MNQHLTRVSTAEAIVNYFRTHISEGTLSPGDPLPSERELQARFGISRFSLREGLARLSALGLIRIVHGKGAFVADTMSEQSLEDVFLPLVHRADEAAFNELCEARQIIESQLSALAARRHTEENRAALLRILADAETARDDPGRFGELDLRFHRAIARAARNVFLEKMLEMMTGHMRAFLLEHARAEKSRTQALKSHRAILDAIVRGNGPQAAELTRRHIAGCKLNFDLFHPSSAR